MPGLELVMIDKSITTQVSRQLGYSLTQIRSQSFGIRYYPMLPICIVYHELRMYANNNQCFNAINRHHPRTDLP